jgi:hypothetical protein
MAFAETTTYFGVPDIIPQTLPCAYPSNTFDYEPKFANTQTYFPPRFVPGYVPPPCPPAIIPEMVAFGEQDILGHRFVNDNRYDAQKSDPNIFIRPTKEPEPYTRSLFQTPYDSTQNLISDGVLVNPALGEVYECFSNQLPPPNTNKGAALRSTFEKVNPRLVWLNGGQNGVCGTPENRRQEVSSELFAPVSAIAGKPVPFATNYVDKEIVKQQRIIGARDLYNNRNGDYPVEISMNGEQPWGYVGLQPAYNFMPVIPATQELNLCGRMQPPLEQGTNLTQREQYTGDFFSRKAHVLVTRDPMPTNLINGTEAVTIIPIASEHPNKQEYTQSYITPAALATDTITNTLPVVTSRPGPVNTENTIPVAPVNAANFQPTQQPIDLTARAKILNSQTLPIGVAQLPAGDIIPVSNDVRATLPQLAPFPTAAVALESTGDVVVPAFPRPQAVNKLPNTLPISQPVLESGGVLVGQTNLTVNANKQPLLFPVSQPILEVGDLLVGQQNLLTSANKQLMTIPFQAAPPAQPHTGSVLVNQTTIPRATNKLVNTFPITAVGMETTGSTLVAQTTIRPTLKSEQTLPISEPNMPQAGSTLVNQTTIRPKDTISDQPLPTSAIAPISDGSGYVLVDTHVHDTQRMFNPIQSYTTGPQSAFGDLIIPNQIFTHQNRGICPEAYVTAVSRVPQGQGGTSTRVVPKMNLSREKPNPARYLHMPSDPLIAQSPKIIPSARLTFRAIQDIKDYATACA